MNILQPVKAVIINPPTGVPETTTIGDLVTKALNVVMPILGIAFVLMLIFGGFNFLTSAGDANKIKAAQSIIVNALIGFIIVAFAFAIKEVVTRTLSLP